MISLNTCAQILVRDQGYNISEDFLLGIEESSLRDEPIHFG